jgi:hypothetical protein
MWTNEGHDRRKTRTAPALDALVIGPHKSLDASGGANHSDA